jgi:hypothetical protein
LILLILGLFAICLTVWCLVAGLFGICALIVAILKGVGGLFWLGSVLGI